MQKSWANSNDLDRSNKVAWDLGFLAHFLSNTTKPRTGSTATCLNLSLFTQGSGGKFFNNTHCEIVLYFYLDYLWTFPQRPESRQTHADTLTWLRLSAPERKEALEEAEVARFFSVACLLEQTGPCPAGLPALCLQSTCLSALVWGRRAYIRRQIMCITPVGCRWLTVWKRMKKELLVISLTKVTCYTTLSRSLGLGLIL